MNFFWSLLSAFFIINSSPDIQQQRDYIRQITVGAKTIPLVVQASWLAQCEDLIVDEGNYQIKIDDIILHLAADLEGIKDLILNPTSAVLNNIDCGATYTLTIVSRIAENENTTTYHKLAVDFDSSSMQMSSHAVVGDFTIAPSNDVKSVRWISPKKLLPLK